MRNGKIVDRREFFWEDLPELMEPDESDETQTPPGASLDDRSPRIVDDSSTIENCNPERSMVGAPQMRQRLRGKRSEGSASQDVSNSDPDLRSLRQNNWRCYQVLGALKQLYIDQQYVPRTILVPVDFDDRETLAALLAERTGHRIEIVGSPAGREIAGRSRRAKCAAVVHTALPRARTFAQSDSGGARRRPHASGAAAAHRVLRHLAYSGRGNRCFAGGMGGRQDEQVSLSQIQGDDGTWRG